MQEHTHSKDKFLNFYNHVKHKAFDFVDCFTASIHGFKSGLL